MVSTSQAKSFCQHHHRRREGGDEYSQIHKASTCCGRCRGLPLLSEKYSNPLQYPSTQEYSNPFNIPAPRNIPTPFNNPPPQSTISYIVILHFCILNFIFFSELKLSEEKVYLFGRYELRQGEVIAIYCYFVFCIFVRFETE